MIVQFHQGLDIAPFLEPGVHELSGLLQSKTDVVAAAAPLPSVGRDGRWRERH